jgi:hypothetical protein
MRKPAMRLVLLGLGSFILVGGVARAQVYDVDYETPAGTYQPPPPDVYPAGAPVGDGQYYGYVGVHPIPHEVGSGFCYQSAAHFHPYAPFDQYLFRMSNGYFYFIGDVGDFGYTMSTWSYNGNHPIPAHYGGGYCYIDWMHRHPYQPPAGLAFRWMGGAYAYYGGWDPGYYQYRSYYSPYYGGYYRNTYYGNRYYVSRPAHVYRPSLGWGTPGVYRPGVTVNAPGGLSVTVGAPPVRGYVAPPPVRPGYVAPPPSVYVAPPVRPGYVAPPAQPGYVAPPRPTYVSPSYVAPPRPSYVAPPRPSYVAPPRPSYVAPPRPSYASPPRPSYTPRPTYVPPPRPAYVNPPGGGRMVAPPGRRF